MLNYFMSNIQHIVWDNLYAFFFLNIIDVVLHNYYDFLKSKLVITTLRKYLKWITRQTHKKMNLIFVVLVQDFQIIQGEALGLKPTNLTSRI